MDIRSRQVGIGSAPEMPDLLLAAYRQGQQLAQDGKLAEAADRWRAATLEAEKSPPGGRRLWLFSRTAGLLENARQWKEADDLYRQSIQETASALPASTALLLRVRAISIHAASGL